MKRLLSLIAGMVFVLLAVGLAYADGLQPGDGYTSDKMIRDEDIQRYDHDTGQGTFNQMPALPDEVQGSAAGGVNRDDSGSEWNNDTYEKTAPVEKDKTKPADRGYTGGPEKRWDPLGY